VQPFLADELRLQQKVLPGLKHSIALCNNKSHPRYLTPAFFSEISQCPVPAVHFEPREVPQPSPHRPTPLPRGCRLYPVLTRLAVLALTSVCCVLANRLSHVWLQCTWFRSPALPARNGPDGCLAAVRMGSRPGSLAEEPTLRLAPLSIHCWFFRAVHNPASSSVAASQWPFPDKPEVSSQTPLAVCQVPASPASKSHRLPVTTVASSH